jgi:DNA excision repair protein ERCC-2
VIRVDLEAREVLVSVRDLAEWPPGPPRPGGWITRARAELGNAVHDAYRADREANMPGFRAEITLRGAETIDGFEVSLRGRLDGLVETEAGLLVEEVKSVDSIEDPPQTAHLFQLRLYMLLLSRERPGTTVSGRLIRISLADDARRELEVFFDPRLVADELQRKLRAILREVQERHRRARERRELAGRLVFPHEEVRPQQRELIDAFESALADGRPVIASAPTGVGKTAAAMLPALRHSLAADVPLVFATARTTQQRLAADTFVRMAEQSGIAPRELTAVTLANKREMCPPGHLGCHPDHCPLLAAFYERDRREGAVRAVLDQSLHAGPDRIREAAQAAGLCPYYLSLALCAPADLIVGDCNYVYGPGSTLSHLEERGATVIVDEAHQLFDRMRDHYSPFLYRSRLAALASREPPIEAFGDYARELRTRLDTAPASLLGPQSFRLARRAQRLAVRYAVERRKNGPFAPDDPWLNLAGTILQLRDLSLDGGEEFQRTRERDGEAGVGFVCLDPSRMLAARHRKSRGTIAMSATLTSLDHVRETLGFDDLDPVQISVASPFPARNRCVLAVRSVGTRYRERDRSHARIAGLLAEISAVRPGHYAVYFPSFRYLDEVRQHLPFCGGRVLAQRPGMSRASQAAMLERLRVETDPMLLLAVLGGQFAEGIDLCGDALIGAIVVGPGLPQVGFERSAMRDYFARRTGSGFAHAMLHPGMQRVVQAAGRVHRSPDDRGVIVLLGRRFSQRPYRDLLPRHWYRESPAELVVDDPVPRLREFWGRMATEARSLGGGPGSSATPERIPSS